MIRPNAAMETTAPVGPKPFWQMGRIRTQFAKRPTSLMVHIAGHGPRRVYRSDWSGGYFYILGTRKVGVDMDEVLRLVRQV